MFRYIYYLTGGVVVIFAAWFFFFRGSEAELETVTVQQGEIRQEVSVTGKVKPAESVELGFDRSGRISRVGASVGSRVRVGQVLAEIYSGDLASDLIEAQASLKSEEAKLKDLKKGSRQEDIDIAKEKVQDAKKSFLADIEDAYTKADDAIHSKVDTFFSSPRSTSLHLNLSTNPQLKADIETARVQFETKFKAWTSSLAKLDISSNLYAFAGETNEQLRFLKSFLDTIAVAVNGLAPDSTISQTTIDTYKANVLTARTNINTAISNISGAASDLKISESQLAKELAGSTPEEISVEEAAVERAQASVENIRAQISKTRITSPINGVVTKQDAKIGEIVSASAPVISVISDAKFGVEANLPEADVAKVKVGDEAKITLDAYGDDVLFSARVVSVDPAETIVEGVSTYKINLAFANEDKRIKSGLTANIDIFGAKKENTLFVPQRAIISKDGAKYVRVQNPDGRVDEVKIDLGLIGSGGRAEILSGINEGAKVIISGK